jgi:hypothetical protein
MAQSVTLPNLSIVIEVRFYLCLSLNFPPCPTASSVLQFMASSWTFHLKCFRNMNHQSQRFFAFYGTDYLNADYLNGCVALYCHKNITFLRVTLYRDSDIFLENWLFWKSHFVGIFVKNLPYTDVKKVGKICL